MSSLASGTVAHLAGPSMAVLAVSDDGITLSRGASTVLDVGLDGARVWSFRADRDAFHLADGTHRVPWPASLSARLDGEGQVTVTEHVSGHELHRGHHYFGRGRGPILVQDAQGRPLAVDKFGDLVPTFATSSAAQVAPLLDALESVLAALHELGVEAFPAYGTLLGAVRDGKLIGHDDDADVGYVSRHVDPVDATLESFRLQRRLQQRGYRTRRYSGLAFKVEVAESDALSRGLDVFGGFHTQGRLYLMGAVGRDFDLDWIYPLGTTTLEGRTLPAPARPEKLLEAMYGEHWRVPDPSFVHVVPRGTAMRLNDWFRGIRVRREDWDRHHAAALATPLPGPTDLARLLVEREGVPGHVVELGAGRGRNALWLARQGAHVTALDYSAVALEELARTAAAEGLPVETRPLNLLELRSVLGEGARLARQPGPRTLLADDVLGATSPRGRRGAWRLASMALRAGGRLYLEAALPGGDRPEPRTLVRPVRAGEITREMHERGATIIEHEVRAALDDPGRRRGRWVAAWSE